MTPRQVALVRSSFAQAFGTQPALGERLYARLFAAQPELAELFRGDRARQAHALVEMLNTIIGCMDHHEHVVPLVFELGRRHCAYGVRSGHYEVFGEALLGTLQDGLGEAFGAEEREAWQAAYRFMAEIMREATLD